MTSINAFGLLESILLQYLINPFFMFIFFTQSRVLYAN